MSDLHPLLQNIASTCFISLDAEFADGKRMLELSICDNLGHPVYNQRFKPEGLKEWGPVPHNIRPIDVKNKPRFNICSHEIQRIIDKADFILGFALENDIRMLKKEGIMIPEDKKIIELRDWFWILYGKDNGLDYSDRISNESIADTLLVETDPNRLHSSLYDAQITLQSFSRVLKNLQNINIKTTSLDEAYKLFIPVFNKSKDEYDREHTGGYCFIQDLGSRYKVRFNVLPPENDESIIACIEVANRKKAMLDISRMLLGKNFGGNFFVDRISPNKLARFKSYRNVFYSEDSALDTRLLKLTNLFGDRKNKKL